MSFCCLPVWGCCVCATESSHTNHSLHRLWFQAGDDDADSDDGLSDEPHLGANGLVSPTDALIVDGPLLLSLPSGVAERELVEQLIWVLIGVGGTVVNGAGASAALVGAMQSAAVARVTPLALAYVRVMSFIDQARSATASPVLPSLAFALHTQLQDYRALVQALDVQHSRGYETVDGGVSLPRLLHHAHLLAPPLQVLVLVCDKFAANDSPHHQPTAATVLNTLFAMYREAVDPTEQRALQSILNGTFAPYAHIIDVWMDAGVLADDVRRELCVSSEGVPVKEQTVAFVEPVVHHIAAAGRYANALEIDSETVPLHFDVAHVTQWQGQIRAKCSAVAAQVSARLREDGLRDLLLRLHAVCATVRFSAQLELVMRDALDTAVLDAPPLHTLQKGVADVTRFAAVAVSVRAAADPNTTVRQALSVTGVVRLPLSIVVTDEALLQYSQLFSAGHRLVYLRQSVASLFVEAKRQFRHSCHSLTFIRLALALLGALLQNSVFAADAALTALLPTLDTQLLEQTIAAHRMYLQRCLTGALLSSAAAREAYELCLDTVEAFHMFGTRVFATRAEDKLRGMESKAAAMTHVLQAAIAELCNQLAALAERDGANSWAYLLDVLMSLIAFGAK